MSERLCPDPDPRTLLCRRCGRLCEAFAGYGGHFRHALTRCGAPMRSGETCARYAGHAPGHRTRYALDNQNESRRAWVAA